MRNFTMVLKFGFGFLVPSSLFRVPSFLFRVPGFLFRVPCFEFLVSCFGLTRNLELETRNFEPETRNFEPGTFELRTLFIFCASEAGAFKIFYKSSQFTPYNICFVRKLFKSYFVDVVTVKRSVKL